VLECLPSTLHALGLPIVMPKLRANPGKPQPAKYEALVSTARRADGSTKGDAVVARLALCPIVGCTLRLFIFGDGATDVFLRVRSHVDRRVELHPRQDKSLRYVQAHMSTLGLRPRMPSRSLLTHVLTSRVICVLV
jgi:hypothetical protein